MAKRDRKDEGGVVHQVNPAGAMKIVPCANSPLFAKRVAKPKFLVT